MNSWYQLGCLSAASAVGMGAFGAHGLKKTVTDPARLKAWETAALYHMTHSIGLIIASQRPYGMAPRLLTAGITLFSGSLYALVLGDAPKLGAITPIGGVCLIAGWVAMAFGK